MTDQRRGPRQLQKRTATVAATWTFVACTANLLVLKMVAGATDPATPDPLEQTGAVGFGGGPLRDLLGDQLAGMTAQVRDGYVNRLLPYAVLAVVAATVAGGCAGWWYGSHAHRVLTAPSRT